MWRWQPLSLRVISYDISSERKNKFALEMSDTSKSLYFMTSDSLMLNFYARCDKAGHQLTVRSGKDGRVADASLLERRTLVSWRSVNHKRQKMGTITTKPFCKNEAHSSVTNAQLVLDRHPSRWWGKNDILFILITILSQTISFQIFLSAEMVLAVIVNNSVSHRLLVRSKAPFPGH